MVRTLIVGILFGTLTACTSTTEVASHYAANQLVGAAQGGTVTVTAAEDAALALTSVQIPAEALAADTTVTIAEGIPVPTAVAGRASGPVADFGPNGTVFSTAVTITLPFSLPSGSTTSTVEVVAVAADGTQSTLPNASLRFNADNTVSFEVERFARFGCVVPPPQGCAPGEFFCGCPGYGGTCVPEGVACPLNCPIMALDGGGICPPDQGLCCGVCQSGNCPNDECATPDAGNGCPPNTGYCECLSQCIPSDSACPACAPLDGGSSLCPPGETPCCPGDPTTCEPSGIVCNLACAIPDAGGPGCPPGDYFCGCPGYAGTCIPNMQVCDIGCPIEPVDGGPGMGFADAGKGCAPGTFDCCGVCQIGTGACTEPCPLQPDGGNFSLDAGSPGGCGPGTIYCECLNTCLSSEQGACPLCDIVDAGGPPTCGSGTAYCPCENSCLGDSFECPVCDPVADGGSPVPGCGQGQFFCGCPGLPGTCQSLGTLCSLNCPAQGVDAGS